MCADSEATALRQRSWFFYYRASERCDFTATRLEEDGRWTPLFLTFIAFLCFCFYANGGLSNLIASAAG